MRSPHFLAGPLFVAGLFFAAMLHTDQAHAREDCVVSKSGAGASPRLRNVCDRDVNVYACCKGHGNLVSCQTGQTHMVEIEAGSSVAIPSCNGWYEWVWCDVPEVLANHRWNNATNKVVWGYCDLP